MSRAFWADPPWRGGRGPFRLGLAPVAESEWLPLPASREEHARKLDLLTHRRDEVLARVHAAERVVDAVAAFVSGQLAARGWTPLSGDSDPLAAAALQVPEDLCVMMASPQGWVLAGACLCSPSFWRLADKIGRPLAQIHAPVSGLDAVLGDRMARFLDGLPVGRVFERSNWNVHRDLDRFHPLPEQWERPLLASDCVTLHIRSERQTLRRMDAQCMLFTIDVRQFPLTDLVQERAARVDLEAALRGMSPEERAASGYARHGAALLEWLHALPND
jgi:hypothetical protein